LPLGGEDALLVRQAAGRLREVALGVLRLGVDEGLGREDLLLGSEGVLRGLDQTLLQRLLPELRVVEEYAVLPQGLGLATEAGRDRLHRLLGGGVEEGGEVGREAVEARREGDEVVAGEPGGLAERAERARRVEEVEL